MNLESILTQKKNILLYLSKRQLKNTFNALMTLATEVHEWQIIDKLKEAETNYQYMLHYLFEGVEDSGRDQVYNSLVRSLYELTDDICDELLKYNSQSIFYDKLRLNELREPISVNDYLTQLKDISASISLLDLIDGEEKHLKTRELQVRRERIGIDLFNSIFVSGRINDNQANDYLQFLGSIDLPLREKCLFISALTLNLFHRFDSRKMLIMMKAAESADIQVRVRAIVGLIVILQMYDVRWSVYPELQSRLDILSENDDFKKAVQEIIIQLIRARETEQISKKITEEIIPEMMRFNTLAGKKLNIEDLMTDADFSDKNPEWQKELEESGLVNKLQEYSNLQLEGADVFHSTFASLKNYPFFRDLSNWFMPFDTSYSEFSPLFADLPKDNLLKSAIVESTHMCDSDKYSFCLSLLQISTAHRNQMMDQLGAESEQLKELNKDAKAMNKSVGETIASNQYIQNLYRFFKLYPDKNSFFDIFKLRLNFYDKKSIAPLISDTVSMKKIATFCFNKNHFREALDIFNRLVLLDENEDLWQKIGYCRQMLDDLQGALEAYLQADLFTPDNSWILKRIAQLYRSLKKPEKSLEFYQKAAKLTPDNMNLELNIGHCYLELKEYEKALNYYFKVELLDDKSNKALRPIAWTAFLLNKFDLSKKYYTTILNGKTTVHDYLNAAHVEFCMKNLPNAIQLYKKAAENETDFEQFVNLFNADKEILINAGVDKQLFPFLLDAVQYALK